MKKFAVGCLVVVALLAVCGGIAGYWVYSKARSYVGQFQGLAEVDKGVTNTAAFTAPANGELTEGLVKRFAAVQESMHAKLGARVEEMKAKQDEFLRRQQAEHRQASASEGIAVVTDLMKLILEGKKAQVEALNQQHFSLDEHAWVKGQVYMAAGMDIVELSVKNLPELAKQGGGMTKTVGEQGAEVPPRNKELVAPILPKLKDWAPLAFFGL